MLGFISVALEPVTLDNLQNKHKGYISVVISFSPVSRWPAGSGEPYLDVKPL